MYRKSMREGGSSLRGIRNISHLVWRFPNAAEEFAENEIFSNSTAFMSVRPGQTSDVSFTFDTARANQFRE